MAFMRLHTARRAAIIIFAVIALAALVRRVLVEGHASMVSLLFLVALVLAVGTLVRLGWDRAP